MNGEWITALHATVFLYHKGDWLTSEEIAGNVCTNPVCVRRVMTRLVKAGLVERRLGKDCGGYRCVRDLTLATFGDALGARLIEPRWRSGDPARPCMIASGMAGYTDALCAELEEVVRGRLGGIRLSDVERDLRARRERAARSVRRSKTGRSKE